MSRIIDTCQIVSAIIPVDSQDGAMTADVVSMELYNRLTIIIHKDAGTADDDPTFTLLQGTDIAFGTNKALSSIVEYWSKEATLVNTVSTFTKTTQIAANTVVTTATSAEKQGVFVIEVVGSDLDEANLYKTVRLSIADTGVAGAQLLSALYILSEPRHAAATMPVAIA